MFLPTENTVSNKIADVVIYGNIHHQFMDKIYNKTLINAGSVGNSFDTIRNKSKDGNILETRCSNYVIIEGNYDCKEYEDEISFEFVRVQYDIEQELKDVDRNFEKDTYQYELENGMYRNMDKVNENFEKLGIDISKI